MPPVLAVEADTDADTLPVQTQQQDADTDTDADDADANTEADEAAALPELSEDREVAEEDEAAADGDADERALHYWQKDHVVAPTCTEKGYTVEKCLFHEGETRKTNWKDPLDHLYTKYTVTKEATEGADGEQVAVCDRRGCGAKDTQIIHYYGEWEVTKEPTCYAKGEKQRVCVNCSQVDIEEIDMIAYTWSTKYVNDNKPACEQQTESLRCTVCGAKGETRDRANLGSDGNPLPHKYTTFEFYTTKLENKKLVTYYKSKCDYCGHEDNTFTGKAGEIAADGTSDFLTDATLKNVKFEWKTDEGKKTEVTLDQYITNVINKALQEAQEEADKAGKDDTMTKKQALAALDKISDTVTNELKDLKIAVGNGVEVPIDPSVLDPLYKTIDDLKDSLDDSLPVESDHCKCSGQAGRRCDEE